MTPSSQTGSAQAAPKHEHTGQHCPSGMIRVPPAHGGAGSQLTPKQLVLPVVEVLAVVLLVLALWLAELVDCTPPLPPVPPLPPLPPPVPPAPSLLLSLNASPPHPVAPPMLAHTHATSTMDW